MTAPVAYRLVGRILEGLVSTVHRIDLSTQHAHALYVRTLTLYIQCAHIHAARHIHQSAHRSCSHSVLTCSRLCYDTSLAHLLGNQDLSDGIVDLMCASVIEVLALQIELATIFLAHALCEIQWRRTTHIVAQQLTVFLLELLALDDRKIGLLQILDSLVQNLGNISPAELAIIAIFINLKTFHCLILLLYYCRYCQKKGSQDSRVLQARYLLHYAHKGASHNCHVMRSRHHHLFALNRFILLICIKVLLRQIY